MENLKIDCRGFDDKQKQEVVWELNRLGFITGHKSIDFYCFVYGCTGNTAYNNTIQFGNTEKTFAKNKGRAVTLGELKQIPSKCADKEEQGLISGADALKALADGKEVEYLGETKSWFSLNKETSAWSLTEVLTATDLKEGTSFKFRIKPHTIKLELEIPAPFEPKVGDTAYFLSTSNTCGYTYTNDFKGYGFDSQIQFGAWRTEEEIKQVVAALRGGVKG